MYKLLVSLLLLSDHCLTCNNNSISSETLSRKKRWLIFPKGSSLQLVYCWLYSTYGTDPGIFVIGFTVGLAWEIPTDLREYIFRNGKEQLNVRDRRQLYRKIEVFLNKIGHDGRNCVLNSICMVQKLQNSKRLTFIEAILKEIFNLGPNEHWLEPEDRIYKHAANTEHNCSASFPCNVTLFNSGK